MRIPGIISLVLIGLISRAQAPYEYIPDVPDSVIAQRLQDMNSEIPMNFNDEVKKYIQLYTVTNRDYTKKLMRRSTKYFPIFEKYLDAYNLPEELKYLAIIESGLNPSARSRAAAVGLWQFVYLTGKRYDLNVTWYIDDRMDPDMATDAACRFLSYLYGYQGDWELALASYNAGAGRVNKAIRRMDNIRDFYTIYPHLPRETRGYVPKFVAMAYVFTYAAEHNLHTEGYEYLPEYDTIHVSQYLHLKTLAEEVALCPDDILKLNPQVMHGAIPEGVKSYPLKVPVDVKATIVQNRTEIYEVATAVGKEALKKLEQEVPGGVAGRTRIVHRVRSGDVLGKIAQQYGVRVSDLKAWNRLSSSMIRVGQKLNVYVKPNYKKPASSASVSKPLASKPAPAKPKVTGPPTKPGPGDKVYYVQSGDTLWAISKNYNVSIDKLKSMNNLASDALKPGQVLIVGKK